MQVLNEIARIRTFHWKQVVFLIINISKLYVLYSGIVWEFRKPLIKKKIEEGIMLSIWKRQIAFRGYVPLCSGLENL